mgnify:CR=1 FL=1
MYVVLVYDISQEKNGAKRWSKIFKISKKYFKKKQALAGKMQILSA